MATEDVIARYKLDLSDLQAKVSQIEKEFGKTEAAAKKAGDAGSASMKKVADATNPLAKGLEDLGNKIVAAFAIERIIAFGAASVKAFQDAEKTAKLLNVALGVSGGTSAQLDRLLKQSKDLEKISIFSDDDIQKVQTAALQFGLTADQVEKLLPLVADFASATGQDLRSALDAVTRGIEGQGKGLKQYGILLQEGATRVENLDRISQQLTKTYSGQAEIVGNTASGAQAKLNNQMNNTEEIIGEKLVPAFLELRRIAVEVLGEVVDSFEKISAGFNFITNKGKFNENFGEKLKKDAKEAAVSENEGLKIFEIRKKLDEANNKLQNELLDNKNAIDKKDETAQLRSFQQARILQGQIEGYRKLIELKESANRLDKPQGRLAEADAEDAAKKAADAAEKARLKAIESDKKDFDAQEAAAKELDKLLEDSFNRQLDLIDQETVAQIKAGETVEQAERNKLRKLIQLRIDYGKDVGALLLQQAEADRKIEIHPNREDFEKNQKLIDDAQKEADEKKKAAAIKLGEQIKDLQIQFAKEAADGILTIAFASAAQQNEIAQQKVNDQLDIENKAIDTRIAALEEQNRRGLLSDAKLVIEKKKLEEQKVKDQQAAQAKINALKHAQDVANQQQALAQIAIDTAATVLKTTSQVGFVAGGALIPLIIGLGALEAAIVLATPLPKYFKGTPSLQRGSNPFGRDTIPFMGHEGEAIIPTDQNKKYPGLAKAWITNDLDKYLNQRFVTPALQKQKELYEKNLIIQNKLFLNEDSFAQKIAAEIVYQSKGSKEVNLSKKSIKQIAEIIELNNDLRRH